jgi:hypothetical protein
MVEIVIAADIATILITITIAIALTLKRFSNLMDEYTPYSVDEKAKKRRIHKGMNRSCASEANGLQHRG